MQGGPVYRVCLGNFFCRSLQGADSNSMKSARSALYLAADRLLADPSRMTPRSVVETDHTHCLRRFRTLISND